MKSIVFKSTMPAVITRFTTAALLLLALAACNSGGSGGSGGPITGNKPTSLKPTELVAKGFYEGIDLTWKEAKGATRYTVYYHTASFSSTTEGGVKKSSMTTTNASIEGLSNGTLYYLRVAAINNKGKTELSTEMASATTNLQPPTELIATGVYEGVELSWKESKGATSYKVYYHTDSFSSTTVGGVISKTVTAPIISITHLTNGTPYYLRVKAINDEGKTELSTKLSEKVEATPTKQAPNLRAIGVNQAIVLSWDAVKYASSYTVYYRKDKGFNSTTESEVSSKTETALTTKTSITHLTNGKIYYLRAVTNYPTESSHLSKQVKATVNLQTPTNVVATGGDKTVNISWNAVTGADSYKVYYHTASFSSTAGVSVKTAQSPALSTSITGLTNGTKYYLRVEVIAGEEKKLSAEVSATPTTKLLTLHPSAAASIISLAAVDLSWDALAGVTNYKIYYAKQSLDKLGGGYKNNASVGGGLKTITDTKATSTTIGDLSADTTYYFVVAVNYNNGEEKSAPEVSASSSYIAELSMGGDQGCVRLNTGGIKCWGWNKFGQLGVDYTTDRYTATSVSGNLRAKQISVGGAHSCAIDLSDRLYCWGSNTDYKIGLSDNKLRRHIPTLVTQARLTKVSLITTGWRTTCAVADGKNYCLGAQDYGALGNGVASDDLIMDAQKINDITPDVKQFALGFSSGCAIDASDDLWCWGRNANGQVGDDTTTVRPSPVNPKLQGSSTATMLDGKYRHYCAVDGDTEIQCWGWNSNGQLGINSRTDSNSPQYVLKSTTANDYLSNVSKVVTGYGHSCALIAKGKVRCWGGNAYSYSDGDADGIIGINYKAKGAATRRLIADTDMPEINNAIDIASGAYHTCVLLKDKARVKCWGYNIEGQLGNGNTENSYMPVEVQGLYETYKYKE